MRRQSKKILTAVTLSVGLLAGAGIVGNQMHKVAKHRAEEKQKREALIVKLQKENRELSKVKKDYDASHAFYADAVAKNAKENPDCDDMDKLYVLCEKMDSVIGTKYNEIESKLIASCKQALKKYETKHGYEICGDGANEYIRPVTLSDWMAVAYEHSDEIPNFAALEFEYNRLVDLENLIWDYETFLGGKMAIYVDDTNRRQHQKEYCTYVSEEETTHLGGGMRLDGTVYSYVDDDVRKYNDFDNIEQDQIIKELLQKYMYPFIVYGENGLKVMNDDLFNQIHHLALRITGHNELEAGKNSYAKAIAEITKQIKGNEQNIASLQQPVR